MISQHTTATQIWAVIDEVWEKGKGYDVPRALLELRLETESWPEVVSALEQLNESEEDERRIAACHFMMAIACHDKLEASERAVEHLASAFARAPEDLRSFFIVRIDRMTATANDTSLWQLANSLSSAARDSREPARHPVEASPRERIVEERASSPESEIEAHRRAIRENPFRVDSYKALRKTHFDLHEYDKAWCLCAALSFLKKADEEEEDFYRKYCTKGIIRAQARLNEELWVRNLFHQNEDLLIGKVFATILPVVREFKVQPHRAFGLKKKHRHDPLTSSIALAKTFAYVAQVMNLPFLPELYLRPDQATGLCYAITDPPASVAGQLLLSGFTPHDLTYEVARHLTYYRGDHYIRWSEPTKAGLRVLLRAAVNAVMPEYETPHDPSGVLEQTTTTISKKLSPLAQEQLTALVKRFVRDRAQPYPMDEAIETWVKAVEMTASRAGFVLCNSLPTAARMAQNQTTLLGDPTIREKVEDLVLFSISEEYFRLRQALGIAITSA